MQERERRKDIERYAGPIRMPPLDHNKYLIEYLFEFGPVKDGEAIDAQDLVNWEHLLGIEWEPWQSRLLVKLSKAYLGESHAATKRDAPPPWGGAVKQWRYVQHCMSERRLDAFLR